MVGDRKSPPDWQCEGVVFLSIEDQGKEFPLMSGILAENTYVRKMLGYLYAIRHGAKVIFETDDDNIPYPHAQEILEQDLRSDLKVPSIRSEGGWVNVYPEFDAPNCWPRGYPLNALLDPSTRVLAGRDSLRWGVMQYLADGDPDVDAIFRMTRGEQVYFKHNHALCLDKRVYSPFNSQATLWLEEFFPLLFLPIGICDRVTDILRGYMTLSCLWSNDRTLGFSSPLVYQERNDHNLLADFEQEIDLYRFSDKWSKILLGAEGNIPESAFRSALKLLVQEDVLPESNCAAYEAFLQEKRH